MNWVATIPTDSVRSLTLIVGAGGIQVDGFSVSPSGSNFMGALLVVFLALIKK